jgi:predicted TPR repeat methyltransferase
MNSVSKWDEYADGWDTNEDVRHYAELAFAKLEEHIQPNGLRVLDFGCGTGLLTEKLAPHASAVIAIDPSTKMVEVLREKNITNVTVIEALLTSDLLETEPSLQHPFDLIVASSVCAFLPDFLGTLSLFKRLLKPGGHFVQWDWKASEESPDFGFTPDSLTEAYKAAGLEVVLTEESFVLATEKKRMATVMGVAKRS